MLPQKKYYRQRAHSNPLSDHCFDYPLSPDHLDWNEHFGNESEGRSVDFLDIGCGYGGLLVELSPLFPEKRILGLEIRVKVSDYVKDRIKSLREQNGNKMYNNIACLRTNAMKYLPNYVSKGDVEKVFFLFPDPHFKKTKHKWRIISQQLLAEYAFILKIDIGRVYIATDVKDLYEWMTSHFDSFPLFQRLSQNEEAADEIVPKLFDSTEEGKKVTRMGGEKFIAVYKRIPDPFQSG